jgi:sugar phosphate isomerase/epimerase
MRLGIGSYAFAWAIGVPGHPPARPMTAFDLLEEVARLDVRLVQICDNLPLTQLAPAELDRFAARAQELNIQVEVGTLGLNPENLRAYLQLARRFQCPFVRVVVDSKGDEPTPEEIVTRLRPLVAEFAAAHIRVAIENHDRLRSGTLAWIVEQLGPENAGICLDTVNSFGALEGPEVVVQALAPYTLCLHAKDFTIQRVSHRMGFVLEGCPAGSGQLDVPWLLTQLAKSRHSFNVILETWVPPDKTLAETIARERAWTETGKNYLRTLISN